MFILNNQPTLMGWFRDLIILFEARLSESFQDLHVLVGAVQGCLLQCKYHPFELDFNLANAPEFMQSSHNNITLSVNQFITIFDGCLPIFFMLVIDFLKKEMK